MKYKLNFSTKRIRNDISGARKFKYDDFSQKLKSPKFPIKFITLNEAVNLCLQLGPIAIKASNIREYLKDEEIGIGRKSKVDLEINRIEMKAAEHKGAQIITLPFKCPVPAKTNYHTMPDFGEMMFIHRLGKICKEISTINNSHFRIIIFEETDALTPVFNISSSESKQFQKRIAHFIKVLNLSDYLELRSLQQSVILSEVKYQHSLKKESHIIFKNIENYKEELQRVLPTIALSINTTNLSINQSRFRIHKLFSSKVDVVKERSLINTAVKYLAFLKLHKRANVRDPQFMQFTITPSKNRIGVRPTLKHVSLLPHHGVPVVYKRKDKLKFDIEYYSDFLINTKKYNVYEIQDEGGNFLFYEVNK